MRDLKQIAEDILTQDNRGTASPMLILLQVKKEYVAHDEFYDMDSEEVYVENWTGDHLRFHTEEELMAFYNEDLHEDEQVSEIESLEDKYEKYHMNYFWHTENVFFSDKGYEEHMAMNSHNYRKGQVRSYGIYAFRNPEMESVMKMILSHK